LILGSTKNSTGMRICCPGSSRCWVKQKHWILVKYWPAWVGVTLKLAVPTTGAYCYTMSNNYNGNRRIPVVFARDEKARLVVRRETWDDLFAVGMRAARALNDVAAFAHFLEAGRAWSLIGRATWGCRDGRGTT